MTINSSLTPSRTSSVRVAGDDIVFDVRGVGSPVVLLPGTPGDASAFAFVADALAADHTVVTYDPRGFGRSTGHLPRRYEIGQQALDVLAVLAGAGIDRAVFVGNSAGALVGLDIAANHPAVTEALIAHEPPAIRVLPDATEYEARIAQIYHAAWTDGAPAAFLDFLLLSQLPFNAGKPFTRDEVDAIRPNAASLPGLEFSEFYMKYQLLPLTSFAPDLARISQNGVRVFAGAGELSLELPFGRASREISTQLGTQFLIFPGHHGSLSDPATSEAWTTVVRRTLAAL